MIYFNYSYGTLAHELSLATLASLLVVKIVFILFFRGYKRRDKYPKPISTVCCCYFRVFSLFRLLLELATFRYKLHHKSKGQGCVKTVFVPDLQRFRRVYANYFQIPFIIGVSPREYNTLSKGVVVPDPVIIEITTYDSIQ